ncbi:hypothetical protein NQ314_016832 [Rhamnusium bicolor]|uniref:Heat shock protein 70 n=1 Tax=Rhamnusium bicolor TaxID=1586634 RepID=A0AAV8WUQ1_9CUCU|nr:hypothetical protein NQ314_016832 [Rhamnusium bicolor]
MGRKFDDEYVSKFVHSNEVPFTITRAEDDQAAYEVSISDKNVIISPEEVSAEVLKYLKKIIRKRKATIRAAELAGLTVLKLITEPTAAAVHYISEKEKNNANVLVFDFGGGTLDVSIIKVSDKQFEVKAVYGDTFLGGRNFDELLFNHFYHKYLENQNVKESRKRIFLRRLRIACVELKKKLSTSLEARLLIPSCFGGDEEILLTITKAEFEELASDIFERALEIVKLCLYDSGTSKSEIDEVVLVGGTTRIPKLKTDVHPDEAVAAGASLQAALLKENLDDLEKYKITEVTPLSLGIETTHKFMDIFIPKNSPLPFKATKRKTTTENEQDAVRITIFEGERKNVTYNNLLGEFIINGFPPRRAGDVEYNINFELDEDGVLNVTASEESTGIYNKLAVTMGQFRLSERKIKISIEEAKKHELEDDVFQKFTSFRNSLEVLCNQIMYDAKKISSTTERETVEGKCKDFLAFTRELDFTEIDRLEARFAEFSYTEDNRCNNM